MSFKVMLTGTMQAIPTPMSFLPFVTLSQSGGSATGGDGGTYGPATSGSTTLGWQEFLNQRTQDGWIAPGNYVMPPTFQGLTAFGNPTNFDQTFFASRNANLIVPNGFSGIALTIGEDEGGINNNLYQGGAIREAGAQKQLWTGVRKRSTIGGNSWTNTRDILIVSPNVGVEYYLGSSGGYFTGNEEFNLKVYEPHTAGFLWTPSPDGNHSFNYCKYDFCQVQMGPSALHPNAVGFKNIDGTDNTFDSCTASDATGGQFESTIAPTAINTKIIGGALNKVWINSGINTKVF